MKLLLKLFLILGVPIMVWAQAIYIENPSDGSRAQNQAVTPIDAAEDSKEVIKTDYILRYTFTFNREVGAALFRRGEYVWMVFDEKIEFDLSTVRRNSLPYVKEVEQLSSSSGSVLVFRISNQYTFALVKEGLKWRLGFYVEPKKRKENMELFAVQSVGLGKTLQVRDGNASDVIGVLDKLSGGLILIGTTRGEGFGHPSIRQYQGFVYLETYQGLAIESFTNDIELLQQAGVFLLHSSSNQYELPINIANRVAPTNLAGGQTLYSSRLLFNWTEWGEANTVPFRERMPLFFKTIYESPRESVNDARLNMAKYYLANRLGNEALGVLDTIFKSAPLNKEIPEIKALYGVALFQSAKYQSALEVFKDPAISNFAEIALWEGAALAKLSKWKDAEDKFQVSDRILTSYPSKLKGYLGLIRLESAIEQQQKDLVEGWLYELKTNVYSSYNEFDRARLNFLDALYTIRLNSEKEKAVKMFDNLRITRNRYINARSRFEATLILQDLGKMSVVQAIKELSSVRYGWRGDAFESLMVIELAKLYFKSRDYKEGFLALRSGIASSNNRTQIAVMSTIMEDNFKKLFFEGEANQLAPLKALSLYDQFRELTPAGEIGDYIIESLAYRLLSIDLVERAAELLDYQVKYRLDGQERSRVGTKLAVVYLINKNPEQAIKTIEDTRFPGLANELLSERRRILAKAFIDRENFEQAQRLLVGDVTEEADLLRLEDAWHRKDWYKVADVLRRQVNRPAGISIKSGGTNEKDKADETQARLVFNLAVALKLIDDYQGLENLRDRFHEELQTSFYGRLFDTLTSSSTNDTDLAGSSSIIQQITGEEFRLFLDRYRYRMLTPSDKFLGLPNRALIAKQLDGQKPKTEEEVNVENYKVN